MKTNLKTQDLHHSLSCLQDIRVYLTRNSQEVLDCSSSVKPVSAELLWASLDVEPITFNRGFYTVDIKYYYRITADAYSGVGRPRRICGLATFDKRTVLFGSEGNAHIFSSQYVPGGVDIQGIERTNLPTAVVEVVDPVVLGAKTLENCGCGESPINDIPEVICGCFEDDIVVSDEGKRLYITLGQFSIIKLEREIQLLMPAYDICMPNKECNCGTDDPCELFQRFNFPVDEFFPPRAGEFVKNTTCANKNR